MTAEENDSGQRGQVQSGGVNTILFYNLGFNYPNAGSSEESLLSARAASKYSLKSDRGGCCMTNREL
jgi:hypothetical protein